MKLFFYILNILLLTIAFGQSKFKKVNSYLDSLETVNEFSGRVLIIENGKVKLDKGYGYADLANKYPNTKNTQFCLSSTSKLFTGTAIIKLIEEDAINQSDSIGTYIKGLDYGKEVTIHQLLTHSSGLQNFYDDSTFTMKGVKSCHDIVKYIKHQKLTFKPGTNVKYSTSGMMLLGAVIEKVSSLTYQEYIQQTIFKPLGMKYTSFVNYKYTQYEKLEPSSYSIGYIKDSLDNIVIRKKKWDSPHQIPLAAGGIWSCASDLAKFDKAIHSGKIIDKKHLELMISPKIKSEWPNTEFGYVWLNINVNKPTHAVGHAGNTGGHHNTFYRYDKNLTTILILTNFGFVDVFNMSDNVEKILFD
jgi:CubicO group peptidase (beta-lactamase class C family)